MEQPPPPPPPLPRRLTYDFAVASYRPSTGAVTMVSTASGVYRFFIPELMARYPVPVPDPAPAHPPPLPAPIPAPESDESDPEEEGYENDEAAPPTDEGEQMEDEPEVISLAGGPAPSEESDG